MEREKEISEGGERLIEVGREEKMMFGEGFCYCCCYLDWVWEEEIVVKRGRVEIRWGRCCFCGGCSFLGWCFLFIFVIWMYLIW